MAKCKKCGKGGVFIKLDGNGLCVDCLSSELKETEIRLKEAESKITPEILEYVKKQDCINELENERKKIADQLVESKETIRTLKMEISSKKKEIVQLDEEILVQEFGLYKPQFDFATSDLYKERLDKNRKQQKDLITNHCAVTGAMTWSVNGDSKKGAKMVSDMQKLLLRAFN